MADESSASPTAVPASISNAFVVGSDSSPRQVTASPQPVLAPEVIYTARSLSGVFALVSMFSQLGFSPFIMEQEGVRIVIQVYEALLSVAGGESFLFAADANGDVLNLRQVLVPSDRMRRSRLAWLH